jgi:hypothetical protein
MKPVCQVSLSSFILVSSMKTFSVATRMTAGMTGVRNLRQAFSQLSEEFFCERGDYAILLDSMR